MDLGSICTVVELVPDQINGETLSREDDFPICVPRTSDVTLMSCVSEAQCHPVRFAELGDCGAVSLPSLVDAESLVLMRMDAVEFEELQIVIFKLISLKEVEKS